MPRLIDVLTDEERALERRIAELHAEVRRLEFSKDRKKEGLAMLESDIEYAERQRRGARFAGSTQIKNDWTKVMLRADMVVSGKD